MPLDCDYVVIGSGFGGSVSALRLAEKGYRVTVVEKGSELRSEDFPRSNWNLKRWLWLPQLGFRGLFQMRFFRHITVLAGAGVGGGSLVYANTLPTPKRGFFQHPSWSTLCDDWQRELEPHYRVARRILGATEVPFLAEADLALKRVAEKRGYPERFERPKVGVYFGSDEARPDSEAETGTDPYFGGEGPLRQPCERCGGCMTGCRYGAKNSLDKNYLYFARKLGAELLADSEVTRVSPLSPTSESHEGGEEGYRVEILQGRSPFSWRKKKKIIHCRRVVFAGGVLGTLDLLLRLKNDPGALPRLSERLGHDIRTNAEALIGIVSEQRERDYSSGVAIGSLYQSDAHSHGEIVRYGSGSGAFRMLMAPHVPGQAPGLVKLLQGLLHTLRYPLASLKAYTVANWARSTLILLYMRSLDGTLRFRSKRSWSSFFLRTMGSEWAEGEVPTASIPEASQLARELGQEVDGYTASMLTETAFNIPSTAHILGGCVMGRDASEGVIDVQHRVFGYEGLYVVDGSTLSANPGVNPSLTITALAERAMSYIPAEKVLPLPTAMRSAASLSVPSTAPDNSKSQPS